MDKATLQNMQQIPLDIKVLKTQRRIEEWINKFGIDGVYISFSGGKDSTVLLDIARKVYPDILAVYIDTMVEYPEIRDFVNGYPNVTIVKPKMSFPDVLKKYGYPVVSKEQSMFISEARKGEPYYSLRVNGNKNGQFKISKKHLYLLDAPFPISNQCCNILKKNPIKRFEKTSGRHPILGVMAEESMLRTQQYIKTGCNSFEGSRPISRPMGFWREQDVLEYIYSCKIPIASVYGEVVYMDGVYRTTGLSRTRCMYCAYGLGREDSPNRFQQMAISHPKIHKYVLDTLGYRGVLDYMHIPYDNKEIIHGRE